MKILALEFSTARRSVAVSPDGVVRGQAAEAGGRETHAFAMIDAALHEAGMSCEDIECVAVGTGPGSYAGIRIAIAIAQGWQLARGVKLLAVPSADAVAQQAFERGLRGRLHAVADAQRGELFAAHYELAESGARLVTPFTLLTKEGECQRRAAGDRFARCDVAEHAGDQVIVPEAATVAKLAEGRTDFVSGPALEPVYLRKAEFVKAPPARFA